MPVPHARSTKLGFTKVFNLDGGLNAWIKDNLPLTKSAAGGKAQLKMSQPEKMGQPEMGQPDITMYATGGVRTASEPGIC